MDIFAEARSIVTGLPSEEAWKSLVEIVAELDSHAEPERADQLRHYGMVHLRNWPGHVRRRAPLDWVINHACRLDIRPWLTWANEVAIRARTISRRGAVILAQSPEMVGIHVLELDSCELGADGLAIFLSSPQLSELRKLVVRSDHCEGALASVINQGGYATTKLDEIYLNDISLGSHDAVALASKLEFVRVLNVDRNAIGDVGASAIARYRLARLESLSLSSNEIGPSGGEQLSTMHAPRLRRLRLNHNPVGDPGGLALLHNLSAFPKLREVSVTGARLSSETVRGLNAALRPGQFGI